MFFYLNGWIKTSKRPERTPHVTLEGLGKCEALFKRGKQTMSFASSDTESTTSSLRDFIVDSDDSDECQDDSDSDESWTESMGTDASGANEHYSESDSDESSSSPPPEEEDVNVKKVKVESAPIVPARKSKSPKTPRERQQPPPEVTTTQQTAKKRYRVQDAERDARMEAMRMGIDSLDDGTRYGKKRTRKQVISTDVIMLSDPYIQKKLKDDLPDDEFEREYNKPDVTISSSDECSSGESDSDGEDDSRAHK